MSRITSSLAKEVPGWSQTNDWPRNIDVVLFIFCSTLELIVAVIAQLVRSFRSFGLVHFSCTEFSYRTKAKQFHPPWHACCDKDSYHNTMDIKQIPSNHDDGVWLAGHHLVTSFQSLNKPIQKPTNN